MKTSLQLRIGPGLTMTPQLQQAIRLLQLSSVELKTEIQEALDSNMMLELEEETADNAEDDANKNADGEPLQKEADDANLPDIPEDLPVDTVWDDIYDGNINFGSTPSGEFNLAENYASTEKSLGDHLVWQLNLIPLSDTDRAIAFAIIDVLDDDGYLRVPLDAILPITAEDTPVEAEEIAANLRLIQSLDPPGVGARDLKECLELQLAQLDGKTPWLEQAKTLVTYHLDLIAAHNYNHMMRALKLGHDELVETIALIRSLNPRPGSVIQQERIEYIVPDIYVKKTGNIWRVELNQETVPSLKINARYAEMIRRADNSADNNSLRTHLQEAKWLIKSLQSRCETLLKVASSIVERQQGFLEHGDEAMKPLVLHDIADELGMHESTVSRVTTRKYMHTPRGIFELKYFFSSHINNEEGDARSSIAIRAMIRKMIADEDPKKPLSDSKIATLLDGQGIKVARRTVAKYREALSIPPSNERKQYI